MIPCYENWYMGCQCPCEGCVFRLWRWNAQTTHGLDASVGLTCPFHPPRSLFYSPYCHDNICQRDISPTVKLSESALMILYLIGWSGTFLQIWPMYAASPYGLFPGDLTQKTHINEPWICQCALQAERCSRTAANQGYNSSPVYWYNIYFVYCGKELNHYGLLSDH